MHFFTKKQNVLRPTLLVTGFGSFDEFNTNPSGDIVEVLDGSIVSGVRIVGLKVPVLWEQSWQLIENKIEEVNPTGLLCLGLAPEPFIRLEVIARNFASPFLDVEGRRPPYFPNSNITKNAPGFYPSSLPINWLKEEYDKLLKIQPTDEQLLPIRFSQDAGGFLCNYVFYQAMNTMKRKIPFRGFIHIPSYNLPFERGITTGEVIFSSVEFLVEKLAEWLRNQSNKETSVLS